MTLKCFMLHLLFGLCIGSAQGADWPTYHGGADLRGFSAADLPESLQRLWIYNTNGRIDNPPVSDGVRIFATPGKGRVVALSIDGKSLWEKTFLRAGASGGEMPLRFDAPLLCHAGLVFSGSSRGTLLALDAATGEERWRLDTGGTLLGSPSVIDEQHIVILDQGEGILRCIDIRNGREVWATEGVARCDSSPGVGGGSIVFGS
ncbi:MAG: PQQ-like beta-propeller repeat protein, partial [Pontiellaceae bacterium]|nr:PQQ-like beta-propeller repeat protein [Pontiellaceae bacterium]